MEIKYLNNPNNKKNWDSLNEVLTSTSKGLAEQFGTTEGLENMFIGAYVGRLYPVLGFSQLYFFLKLNLFAQCYNMAYNFR